MKRKYHLAFRLRNVVERHCQNVPDAMGWHLLTEIEKHLEEERIMELTEKAKEDAKTDT